MDEKRLLKLGQSIKDAIVKGQESLAQQKLLVELGELVIEAIACGAALKCDLVLSDGVAEFLLWDRTPFDIEKSYLHYAHAKHADPTERALVSIQRLLVAARAED